MVRANWQKPIGICVVAENCLARAYLLELFRKEPSVKAVTLEELLASRWPATPPAVFVVDRCGLTIPLGECFRRLRSRFPKARFLVLGPSYDKDDVVGLMILGAHGFLEQERSREVLMRAIQFLAQGQLWVAPDVLEVYLREVAAALRHSQQGRGAAFTPRETQILDMVRSRMSNREIAGLLKIRVSTVKFHLTNILSKQHVGCRRELLSPLHSEIWNRLAPDLDRILGREP